MRSSKVNNVQYAFSNSSNSSALVFDFAMLTPIKYKQKPPEKCRWLEFFNNRIELRGLFDIFTALQPKSWGIVSSYSDAIRRVEKPQQEQYALANQNHTIRFYKSKM